ncbi:hypothetical protein MaudMau93_008098 [Microsporum audouinii]
MRAFIFNWRVNAMKAFHKAFDAMIVAENEIFGEFSYVKARENGTLDEPPTPADMPEELQGTSITDADGPPRQDHY